MKNQSTLKTFFKFTSLNVLAMISLSCYILADTYFISKAFGANGLTALNLAIPIYSLINGIGLMIGIGGATKFSIYKGKNKHCKGNITFTNSILLGFIFSTIFIFLGLFFSLKLSIILGADLETLYNTNVYLKTILLFAPFFIINNILIAFIRNDGNPKLAMIAMFIGSFSNIVLDYIFMFPLNMGMFGAAFATGLAPVISMLSLSYYFIKKKNTFKLDRIQFVPIYMKSIIKFGLSSFIIEISSGIVIIIFNIIILNISGNIGVAAYGIIANLSLVAMSIFNGIGQGIQPIISNNFGISNKDAIKQTLIYAIITTFILSILLYIITFLNSSFLVGIFNSSKDRILEDIASKGLIIYFTGFIFVGFNLVVTSFLNSINNPNKAFIISISRGFLLIIPLVIVLSKTLSLTGVWLSFTVTELLSTSLCFYFLKTINIFNK